MSSAALKLCARSHVLASGGVSIWGTGDRLLGYNPALLVIVIVIVSCYHCHCLFVIVPICWSLSLFVIVIVIFCYCLCHCSLMSLYFLIVVASYFHRYCLLLPFDHCLLLRVVMASTPASKRRAFMGCPAYAPSTGFARLYSPWCTRCLGRTKWSHTRHIHKHTRSNNNRQTQANITTNKTTIATRNKARWQQ